MPDFSTEIAQRLSQSTYHCDWPAGLRKAYGYPTFGGPDPGGVVRMATFGSSELSTITDNLYYALGNHALVLPGVSGSYISTPDAAALDIVGDIDIRVEFTNSDALYSVSTNPMGLLAKWEPTGNLRSYKVETQGFFGQCNLVHSNNGTAEVGPVNTGPTPPALRWTLTVANGTKTLFTSSTMDGPWTQVDQDAGAATAIFASTAVLVLGSTESSGDSGMFKGRITRAQVRNGVDGTVVANPDFRNLAPGTTSFADSAGLTWTLQGNAVIV